MYCLNQIEKLQIKILFERGNSLIYKKFQEIKLIQYLDKF